MKKEKRKKKELIQHNVTYKKLKIKKKKKKERKRTWFIAIRNFDIYIYIYIFKCHKCRNYQINGDIYYFLEYIEIIKLLEIYIVS